MVSVLRFVQNKWSSENPQDRFVGWIGKLLIEGGMFLIASISIGLVAYITVPTLPVGIGGEVGFGGVFSGTLLILFNNSFLQSNN
jgi:hypothetical protein